jgi:hypothetical protein
MWQAYEPCGNEGQYTSSIKSHLNFSNPVGGGTFDPNSSGQATLARVVGCHLNANPTRPDPFLDPALVRFSFVVPTAKLVAPASSELKPIPGSTAPIRGCT